VVRIEEQIMFEGLLQPMHLLVILAIAFLVFGPKRLPELGKGIGQGIRSFKSAINAADEKTSHQTVAISNKKTGGDHAEAQGTPGRV
jgi:sec-independent protein translocase protein TatA